MCWDGIVLGDVKYVCSSHTCRKLLKIMLKIISLDFKRYSQAELALFANNIVNCMTKDEQFITLKPFVDTLKGNYDAFTTAVSDAVNGGTLLIREKNRKMDDLKAELVTVAIQIEALANENEDIIEAAGYQVRETPKPITELVPPAGLTVLNVSDKSGAVKLSWKPTPGAVTYGIERLYAGETVWQNGDYSTASSTVITDLKPGSQITLHVRAIGTKGKKSGWSQEVTVWVS